jgi:hypothetical protein
MQKSTPHKARELELQIHDIQDTEALTPSYKKQQNIAHMEVKFEKYARSPKISLPCPFSKQKGFDRRKKTAFHESISNFGGFFVHVVGGMLNAKRHAQYNSADSKTI